MEELECPFSEVGCQINHLTTITMYHKHLAENVEQHLKLVMELHRRALGHDSPAGGTIAGLQSPLEKLNRVNNEVMYLDSVLGSYGMNHLPALECIKTQLQLPDASLKNLGDSVTFRMSNFTQLKETSSKWLSPPFHVRGGHKMCLRAHANGYRAGAGTHVSVSLLLLFDDQLEWPISLPHYLAIRVELMQEDQEGGSSDEPNSNETDVEVTWQPKDGPVMLGGGGGGSGGKAAPVKKKEPDSSPPIKKKSRKDFAKFRTASLPPWCTAPPVLLEDSSSDSPTPPPEDTHPLEELEAEEETEGVILISSEKFASMSVAESFAQNYNSLIFRVALCLM